MMHKVFGILLVGLVIAFAVSSRTFARDFTNWNDAAICVTASVNGYWSVNPDFRPHVKEAKRRGLTCDVKEAFEEKQKAERQKQKAERQKVAQKKQLGLDKCLLKVFEKFPEHKQSEAEYLCRVVAEVSTESILVNCLMDKGMNKNRRLVDAAANVCVNIAADPSTMDLLRYDSPLSKYLRMFDGSN